MTCPKLSPQSNETSSEATRERQSLLPRRPGRRLDSTGLCLWNPPQRVGKPPPPPSLPLSPCSWLAVVGALYRRAVQVPTLGTTVFSFFLEPHCSPTAGRAALLGPPLIRIGGGPRRWSRRPPPPSAHVMLPDVHLSLFDSVCGGSVMFSLKIVHTWALLYIFGCLIWISGADWVIKPARFGV